jgi:RNA polymerase sigma-70 factor (ECF subfamily)
MEHIPDKELMKQFSAYLDETSFNEIVSRYLKKALACAYAILGNNADAEDAVQETFLRIIRARNTYDPEKPFSPWFFTILRHICFDMQSAVKKETPPFSAEQKGESLLTEEDILEQVPETDRRIITMRVLHGFSVKDIAEALGCSYEAAKKRCQRALLKLQEKFP